MKFISWWWVLICLLQTLYLMDLEQCPRCRTYSFMMEEFTTDEAKWICWPLYCVFVLITSALQVSYVVSSYLCIIELCSYLTHCSEINKLVKYQCKCCTVYGEHCSYIVHKKVPSCVVFCCLGSILMYCVKTCKD